MVEELGRALAPGPFVPTVIASALLASAATRRRGPACCPGLADELHCRRGRPRRRRSPSRDGAASGDAGTVLGGGARPACCSCGPATTCVVVERRARRRRPSATSPANLDPTRRAARVTLDGAPATVLAGARRQRSSTSPASILAAEAVGVARESHRAGRRLRQGAQQFGRPDRHVPGREAPLRQHGSWPPSWPPPPCGTPPGRRRDDGDATSSPTPPPSPPPLAAPAADLARQPQHPGARRHRHHLGARLPPLHAPGHDAARRMLDADAAAVELTDLTRRRRGPAAHGRAAAGGRGRSAPRCGRSSTSVKEPRRPTAQRARLIDDRLRHAPLAQAVRPGRRGHRAARDRAGVRRRRHQAAAVRHHRRGSSSR